MNLLEAKTFKDNIKKLPMSGDVDEISVKLHNNTAADIHGNEIKHLKKIFYFQ